MEEHEIEICKFENCMKPVRSREMCIAHYNQEWRRAKKRKLERDEMRRAIKERLVDPQTVMETDEPQHLQDLEDVLALEIERLHSIAVERPLDNEEIRKLDKLATHHNKLLTYRISKASAIAKIPLDNLDLSEMKPLTKEELNKLRPN